MTVLNGKKRRGTVNRLADHPEPCEMRVLPSGVAIYPAQVVVQETTPVASDKTVSPLVSASDFNGTWETSLAIIFDWDVKGNDPETGKVKGTASSLSLVGGSTKFKGKISNGDELNGQFRGKLFVGVLAVKVKMQIAARLTDNTHLEGTIHVELKVAPPQETEFTGTRI